MHGSDDSQRRVPTPAEQDKRDQAAVLGHVLAEHPDQLTASELARELALGEGGFAEREAIERAVGELVGAGLLHRQGEAIRPSRAALRFERLSSD